MCSDTENRSFPALGIDFGTKRVGLALTDKSGILAYPYKVITRTTRDALFSELLDIIEKERVEIIVVGLPVGLDGQTTLTTRQAQNFAQSLERRVDVPITMVDERLSSFAAQEELRQCGMKTTQMKQALDSQAAVHILNAWLGQRKSS